MRSAIELGASLYIPAAHQDLVKIAQHETLDHARSAIFCTEDSIREDQLQEALGNLRKALSLLSVRPGRMRFVRVRNPEVLEVVLAMRGANLLDGFVLPKVTLENLPRYLALLDRYPHQIMPTLETRETFDTRAMHALCQYLERPHIRRRILAIRIGGNDLLSLLGMRRPKGKTIYQSPIGNVISNLVTIFNPAGFNLTAPAFEYLDDEKTLMQEVREDLDHGLVGKTAVHPNQIPLIESLYKVSRHDLEMAERIIDEWSPAVFKMHDSMCEPSTHRNWARRMQMAAYSFGVSEPPKSPGTTLAFPDWMTVEATESVITNQRRAAGDYAEDQVFR